MSKEEVQKHIIETYPKYILSLKKIETRTQDIIRNYEKDRIELLQKNDFRPGTFGRILSSLMANGFFYSLTLDYVKQENWDKDYFERFMPEIFKNVKYYGHLKEIDRTIRFNIFHLIFHQTETTIRIVYTLLNFAKGSKPIDKVNELTNSFPSDFLKLIDAIRNSIHNNGFYQPIGKQEDKFSVTFGNKKFDFNKDNWIDITTDDIFYIVQEQIELIYKTLENHKIKELPICSDKT